MRLSFVAALMFLPAAPLLADPAMECGAAGSQVEIAACVSDALARVDSALDQALGFAAASAAELDTITGRDDALPALAAAQAAWSAYRDAQCAAVGAGFGGGSGTGIAIDGCRVELGRARVTELLAMVN